MFWKSNKDVTSAWQATPTAVFFSSNLQSNKKVERSVIEAYLLKLAKENKRNYVGKLAKRSWQQHILILRSNKFATEVLP